MLRLSRPVARSSHGGADRVDESTAQLVEHLGDGHVGGAVAQLSARLKVGEGSELDQILLGMTQLRRCSEDSSVTQVVSAERSHTPRALRFASMALRALPRRGQSAHPRRSCPRHLTAAFACR
ncbi:hypothetical protein, partial [uncultured Gordonia sp.]|uniref:hypothetical protein n=1 Tax=uncultured Gordonia sp. TaxID=198437 RepID=UPI002630F01E